MMSNALAQELAREKINVELDHALLNNGGASMFGALVTRIRRVVGSTLVAVGGRIQGQNGEIGRAAGAA